MANLDVLRDAVVAAPDDEAARVAYAAAIEPTDPERAELIKVQLQLARWRKAHERPAGRPAATEREFALLGKRGAEWAKDVKPLVAMAVFLRGFVEHVALDAGAFLQSAPELYRRAPVLHLDLTGVKPVAAELFASPHLGRILSLQLTRNQLGDAEAVLLARSPVLGKLTWLDLEDNQIGQAGLEALAASDRLPRVGYLGFAGNRAPDPTPVHADDYDTTSAAAKALQKKYGKRDWLDARTRFEWPPPRDAVH